MKHVPKPTTDDALIQEFLNKGGKVTKGETKAFPSELGISRNHWNNRLTTEEKAARDAKLPAADLKPYGGVHPATRSDGPRRPIRNLITTSGHRSPRNDHAAPDRFPRPFPTRAAAKIRNSPSLAPI